MKVRNMVIAGIASAQLLIGGSVAAVALSSNGAPAFADSAGYCTASANGCANSGSQTGACSGHGAFGAFGQYGFGSKDGDPDGPGAANPHNSPGEVTTGENNSNFSQVCGH